MKWSVFGAATDRHSFRVRRKLEAPPHTKVAPGYRMYYVRTNAINNSLAASALGWQESMYGVATHERSTQLASAAERGIVRRE